ncbi:MAG: adenylate/guanylate cyclase domain-containing protein [Proteobacteria bacterium]|nr:adenylate/guanylate cyclase domain-containing protein [Pseudomonadota bacterium]
MDAAIAQTDLPREYLEDTEQWVSGAYMRTLVEALARVAADVDETPDDDHEVWDVWHDSGREAFESSQLGPLYGVLKTLGTPAAVYSQVPSFAMRMNRTLDIRSEIVAPGRAHVSAGPRGPDDWMSTATVKNFKGLLEGIPTVWGLPLADVQMTWDGEVASYEARHAEPIGLVRQSGAMALLGGLVAGGIAWGLDGPVVAVSLAGAFALMAADGWRRLAGYRRRDVAEAQRLEDAIARADQRFEELWNEREALRRADLTSRKLSGYLPPALVDGILADPELELTLGGRRTDAAVLFADIVGFTPRCEGTEPEQIVEDLNLWFAHSDRVFAKYGGILDKRMGDGLMVVFVQRDGEEVLAMQDRSIACGLDLLRSVEACNAELAERARLPIQLRVGVAGGQLVQGNMGSDQRLEYTVIGDVVNLAARLESASSPGHLLTQLTLVDSAERTNPGHYRRIEERTITVKGKLEEIPVALLLPS